MPPERHSPPPSRPPRERHGGPGFGGGPGFSGPPRRPFGGGGGYQGGPRPPFTPPPAAPPPQSVRLRDGEREVEVSGSAEFVRQTLDDLPGLFGRLRGEPAAPTRPASITMPAPPHSAVPAAPAAPTAEDDDEDEDDEPPAPGSRARHAAPDGHADKGQSTRARHAAPDGHADKGPSHRVRHAVVNGNGSAGGGSLEDRVFSVLARSGHPMSVAAIRKQLGGQSTGQQIRRILERASDRVVATSERPAAYALR